VELWVLFQREGVLDPSELESESFGEEGCVQPDASDYLDGERDQITVVFLPFRRKGAVVCSTTTGGIGRLGAAERKKKKKRGFSRLWCVDDGSVRKADGGTSTRPRIAATIHANVRRPSQRPENREPAGPCLRNSRVRLSQVGGKKKRRIRAGRRDRRPHCGSEAMARVHAGESQIRGRGKQTRKVTSREGSLRDREHLWRETGLRSAGAQGRSPAPCRKRNPKRIRQEGRGAAASTQNAGEIVGTTFWEGALPPLQGWRPRGVGGSEQARKR